MEGEDVASAAAYAHAGVWTDTRMEGEDVASVAVEYRRGARIEPLVKTKAVDAVVCAELLYTHVGGTELWWVTCACMHA